MMKNSMKLNHLVRLSLCALFFFIGVISVQAATYYVAKTGLDSNPGTSESPFLTIQKCIDTLIAGDTCTVRNGTYSVSGSTRFVGLIYSSGVADGTASSPITLKSANPRGAQVVVPGTSQGGFGFYVAKQHWIIDGFDVRGGGAVLNAPVLTGIGVYTNNIVLRNNTIRDVGLGVCTNTSFSASGIYLEAGVSNIVIEDNLIHTIGRLRQGEGGCAAENHPAHDHGIYVSSVPVGPVTIRRNVFYDTYRGWPIHIYRTPPSVTDRVDIYNNTFAGKNPFGVIASGHILLQTSTMRNINIKNNLSYDAHTGMVYCHTTSNVSVSNVTISFNQSSNAEKVASCIAGFTFANNVINTAPGFVDATGHDYHLVAGSAAIDAGTNVGLQFKGAAPDIGANEFGVGGDIIAPRAPIGLSIR